MLGLKSYSTTHQISPIPSTNPYQKPQTIRTHSSLHLQLKNRRGFNASSLSSEESNKNGAEEDQRVKWRELVLDPDRDNVVAVGLTGALVWAGVQVLWHLFSVTMAIMIAAIKYTFVGVLLIFIVVTLL